MSAFPTEPERRSATISTAWGRSSTTQVAMSGSDYLTYLHEMLQLLTGRHQSCGMISPTRSGASFGRCSLPSRAAYPASTTGASSMASSGYCDLPGGIFHPTMVSDHLLQSPRSLAEGRHLAQDFAGPDRCTRCHCTDARHVNGPRPPACCLHRRQRQPSCRDARGEV